MTQPVQLSGKCGDMIAVLGGATAEEFISNVAVILGSGAAEEIKNIFALALDPATALLSQANKNAIDAFPTASGAASPTPAVQSGAWSQPASPAAPAGPAPSTDGPKTETDNWGSTFTYGIPGAPACPHGERVQKKATSKAGKPYTAWVCPTHTPSAFRQKVVKDPNCSMEFAR